ncbi:glycoside hydrolase family 18 protein [Phellopilus nigrolimitatus]|nr:glycoside hydrolase family 18 protein [Phellopilus nigrolimitatus]
MSSKALAALVVLFYTLAHLSSVLSRPAGLLDSSARSILSRATPVAPAAPAASAASAAPAAPHFVVYSDEGVSGEDGPPDVSTIKGYNVFALSFLMVSGASDEAQEWVSIGESKRKSIKSQYAAAGIKLIVSAFGGTDEPTTKGANAVDQAKTIAAWVKKYDLDGVDVDYEDFDAFDKGDGSAEKWLTDLTTQLRKDLPQGQYLLTHAPIAPWFSPGNAGGAYLTVDKNVGSLIDWYNVQFYNQGSSEYTTCDSLLTTSSSENPKSALFQIVASGIDKDKLVIGKPAKKSDADDGYIAPATLATCLSQAKAKGWNAGAMVWEFPDAAASWISTVRGASWPV